jgi:hypothetical protein
MTLCSLSVTFASVDLSLDTLVLPWGTGLYQYSNPTATLVIRNNGTDTATVSTSTATWFITCRVWSEVVFASHPISTLVINPNSNLQFPVSLSNIATSNLWNQSLTCTVWTYGWWTISTPSNSISYVVLERSWWRFDGILDTVRDPIKNKIDWPIAELWVWGVKSFVYSLIDRFAVRAAVLVGVFFALLALYKIMFSEDENALWQVRGLLVWWIVGIIIIMSAKFIGNIFYTDIVSNGEIWQDWFSLITMVGQLYDLILYPLLKIAFYIMMSVLFVILLIRVFTFVTSTEEEIRKKSMQIVVSTTLWLFIMIASKQLVEWVYGKEALIRNSAAVTITDVWSSFLSNANIPIIYNIIQRVMGLSWFVILALIIFQTFRMLANPSDDKVLWDIRKTLFYALLGMLVIGAGYLIVNVVMVN